MSTEATPAPAAPATPAATPQAAPPAPAPAPAPAPDLSTPDGRREAIIRHFKEQSSQATPAPQAEAAPAEAVPATPPAPVEAPKAEPKPEPVSKQLAGLVERERRVRTQEAELKAGMKELEEYRATKKSAKVNPDVALKALDLTLEDVVDFYANGKKPTAQAQEKSQWETLQAEIQGLKKERESEQQRYRQAAEEQAKNQYQEKVLEVAKANAADFKYSSKHPLAGPVAVQKFEEMYMARQAELGRALNQDEVPTYKDVLVAVEEEFSGLLGPMLTSEQTTGKLPSEAHPSSAPQAASQQGPSPKTLTNAMATAAPTSPRPPQSREERKRLAEDGLRRLMNGG